MPIPKMKPIVIGLYRLFATDSYPNLLDDLLLTIYTITKKKNFIELLIGNPSQLILLLSLFIIIIIINTFHASYYCNSLVDIQLLSRMYMRRAIGNLVLVSHLILKSKIM